MSLDFQQVREQVIELGKSAPQREQRLKELSSLAWQAFKQYADNIDELRDRVQLVARSYDPSLRCARPVKEHLDNRSPLPDSPASATLLAADGSQINLDRHAAIAYCLVNVGAIQINHGSDQPPNTSVESKLYYAEQLYTSTGTITDGTLALIRDLHERTFLAELAGQVLEPIIALTDGSLELWGAKEHAGEPGEFKRFLGEYLTALGKLHESGVIFAGYVDKPSANLVLRLLEVALTSDSELKYIKKSHPLRGLSDLRLYESLIAPGERSAVFALQSQSARSYRDELAIHFFYLNIGRPGNPWLARVEIPAWVAENQTMLDSLHAILIEQCRIMGAHPYPYLLHRAHETALVSLQERDQVTQMIALELQKNGVSLGHASHKQALKDLPGKARNKR